LLAVSNTHCPVYENIFRNFPVTNTLPPP
jgi:hypothetical protein